MITYSPDQLMELLNWLEQQREAGLTLDEIISGLYAGTLTTGIGTTTEYEQKYFDANDYPTSAGESQ